LTFVAAVKAVRLRRIAVHCCSASMADLTRTVDADDDEASDNEMAPTFVGRKKGGRTNFFSGLMSDDEDGQGGGGWNFNAMPAEDDAAGASQPTGLRAKIADRLQQRKEEREEKGEANDAEEDEQDVEKSAKRTKSIAEAKSAAKAAQGTAEHLRTDIPFADLRLSRPLLRAVSDLGFNTPTPIQRDVIPPALQGLDILATAETGSGKTASFLLPALERLCQSPSVRVRKRDANGRLMAGHIATKALIMIPTRELAVQCYAMLKDLAKHTMVTCQLVAGGFGAQDQAASLRQQPDFVVATPGRMLDHLLNSQSVHMELLEIVIFDEADRLLELGFRDECHQVLERCSKGRQTMLFSATMNTSVEDLAKLALVRPVRIHASPVNRVAENIEQEFVRAPSEDMREAVLLSLCSRNYTTQVIIFCATKHAAHRLAIVFGLSGLSFAEIHGNLQQVERVQALTSFQSGEVDFLLATDLAARGLDLQNVSTVINFHLPVDVTRYIHRVGRTARMGRCGRAVTIYTSEEYDKVKKLGRQCCSKVKSKVTKRQIATDSVRQWADKITAMAEDITAVGDEESIEREIRFADLQVSKSENIRKYKKDIESRPKKEWIMTNIDKKKLKEADKERLETEAQAAKEEAPDKKGRKEKKEREDPHERNKRRMGERLRAKREEEKAENLQSEWKVRASARRQRTNAKAAAGTPTPTGQNAKSNSKSKKKKKKKGKGGDK